MKNLSNKEIEILLLLAKDFSTSYNSNNITQKVNITHAGAFKAMKKLQEKGLITGERMGKAVFYKANFKDHYSFRVIGTLLMGESRENASRWLSEFKDLFKLLDIAVIFGSIVKSPRKAKDIDILAVFRKEDNKKVDKFVDEKRIILTKPVHIIKQTPDDFEKNLKKKDKVILSAIKDGYVLHGYNELLEAIKNVTGI